MLKINTNLSSLIAQSNLKSSTLGLNQAIERMTTGFKINGAKDNAAGYSIVTNMTTKIGAYQVAEDNAMMGLDLLTTASENLNLVTSHLQRMRDLAEQASNGTYGASSLNAIQKEIDARAAEIERVMLNTEYNGQKLYGDGTLSATGNFIQEVTPLTAQEAIDQGYTLIHTVDDLKAIDGVSKGKFILMNDIDLSGINWSPFVMSEGEFNGNGYVIKNLTINNPNQSYAGLFSLMSGTVKNLGLEDVNIVANKFVGGITGEINPYGQIVNCYVTGSIKGNSYIGSINGSSLVATGVTACYSSANVTGKVEVGGITGRGGYIRNSYMTGNVTGDSSVGGLSGIGCSISNSYVTGKVVGNKNVGALIGKISNGKLGTASYWNKETTGQTAGAGDVGSSTDSSIGVTGAELKELIKNGTLYEALPEKLQGGQHYNLQVGIDSSSNSVIEFDTKFSFSLYVDVSSASGARDAISAIDNIIKQVTAKQTEFGAVQNRLTSALEGISIQYENLVSSRSTIRDADIAEESSEYIKMQILQQASATLLATANQTPAIALQLL